MTRTLWIAVRLVVVLTLVTGVAYPAVVTALAQTLWRDAADGHLVHRGAMVVGAERVGQSFTSDRYLWGRPSATGPQAYNAAASTGSNLGPTNPALVDAVRQRVAMLRATHPTQTGPVPADLVTTSASGLDPDISLAAAQFQVDRLAAARRRPVAEIARVLAGCTTSPLLGVIGPVHVRVLCVNLALDAQAPQP